jgi:hypothetical protein
VEVHEHGAAVRAEGRAVLYSGDKTLPFGDRLAAVPIAGLWSGSS